MRLRVRRSFAAPLPAVRSKSSFPRRSARTGLAVAALIVAGFSLGAALAASSPALAATSTCAPGSGADFAGKTPTTAQLNSVDLRCADFDGATLSNLTFGQSDLTGADFTKATIVDSDFSQATLTGADLAGANLDRSTFEQATMTAANLTGVQAHSTSFEQVDLTGLSLRASDLRDADFSQATLKRADLSGADLSGATLDQANLTGANLTGANIAGTSLDEATTTDATVTGLKGLPPLDAGTALLTLILALLALAPRLGARAPGRAAAWLVVLVTAAVAAAEVVLAVGWRPTGQELVLLPFLTPVVFIALFVARGIRRPRGGWVAGLLALVQLAGFFLLTSAGLAFLTDTLFGILPFTATCTTVACGGGLARGPGGIVAGIVLILVGSVVGRLRRFAKPAPDLSAWAQLQARGATLPSGFQGTGSATPAGASGSVADAPTPPQQSI
jgi:uncharacterized protein YjbI with pentapeptide repeats